MKKDKYIISKDVILVEDMNWNKIIYDLKKNETYEIDSKLREILIKFQETNVFEDVDYVLWEELVERKRIEKTIGKEKVNLFDSNRIVKYSKKIQKSFKSKAVIYLTNACNLNCIHCWLNSWKRLLWELSDSYFQNIVDQVYDNWFEILQFSWWEPFLKRQLLINLIKKNYKRFETISINTNWILITDKDIEELKGIKNLVFYISIYGYDEKSFLNNTNRKKSWNIEETIKLLIKNWFDVRASLSLHKNTIKDLDTYRRYIEKLWIKKIAFIWIIPVWRAYSNYWELVGDWRVYKDTLDKVSWMIDDSFTEHQIIDHPRHLTKKRIVIYANWEVLPSEFFPISFGNVQNDSLKTILNKKIVKYYMDEFNVNDVIFCKECAYRYICKSVCPSFIYCATWSFINPPITCELALRRYYSNLPLDSFFNSNKKHE